MATSSFRNTKIYHKLNKWDVNVTDINSREDNYQDAVLARLEKEEEEKQKSKRKSKKKK